MSEKRFTLLDETIFDNKKQSEEGGRVTYWVIEHKQREKLVGLLNSLNDENRELRQDIEDYKKAEKNLIKRLDDREKEELERFFK